MVVVNSDDDYDKNSVMFLCRMTLYASELIFDLFDSMLSCSVWAKDKSTCLQHCKYLCGDYQMKLSHLCANIKII